MVRERVKDLIGALPVRPNNPEYGDYTVRIGEDAERVAQKIASRDEIEKAEAKDGFVNITLKPSVWFEELRKILDEREDYGLLTIGQEKTVNVEFISANPTGELHVGNGRGAFFGDVLSNLLEKAGYNVEREYFVNDAVSSVQIQELGKTALGKGESYKTAYLEKILAELKPKLGDTTDDGKAGYIVAQRILKDIKSFVMESLGIRVDRWFSENDLFEAGKLETVKKKLPTYEKEGALWAKTTDFGDDEDRVLVRSDGPSSGLGAGMPGYFLSDIAYHLDKAARADILVDIWGADHQGHVKRMYAAGKALGFSDKLQILITQIVHVKESGATKKMSKRRGELVALAWLLDEVGLDAARFFYLSKALSTHMDFDVALAKEQSQKNPVYYVQYSYARSHQIFAKAQNNADSTQNYAEADLSLLKESSELALIKKLAEYPELIEDIVTGYSRTKNYDLHKLTTYATELSAVFHKFYEVIRVLVDEHAIRLARLALVRGYQIVLKDILDLLGISAPDKM